MKLKFLLEKEFKQLFRTPAMVAITVIFPLVVMLIMPWAATLDIKGIKVSIVDNDFSDLSKDFTQRIQNSTYFELTSLKTDYTQSIEQIEYGYADLVLEIPSKFEYDIINSGSTTIQVSVNSVNSIKGIMGQSYISSLAMEFSQEQILDKINSSESVLPHVSIASKNMYNPTLDYKHTMIPGLIMIIMIVLCGFLPAVNIVAEKERGTIEQLNVTPISKLTFILAKLIPFWIIGFFALSIGFLLAWLVYGLLPVGSFGLLYLSCGLFVLIMTGFGLVVSNSSATMQQATFVMFFFVIIFIMMCGLLTPVDSMPDWAQTIAAFTPTKYMVNILRCIYLRGSDIVDLKIDFIALTATMLFFNIWAVLSYRKQNK
jgi:ABC-2 type transport system permease protein